MESVIVRRVVFEREGGGGWGWMVGEKREGGFRCVYSLIFFECILELLWLFGLSNIAWES